MEKYSEYPITMFTCYDERHVRHSWISLRDSCAACLGMESMPPYISTWTPVPDVVTDRHGYLLFMPRREKLDYFFSTTNQDDTATRA